MTTTEANHEILPDNLYTAIDRAKKLLFARQKDDGSWSANLYYNAWTNATYIITLYYLGATEDRSSIDRAVRWILERQNPDGSWGFLDDRSGSSNLEVTCQVNLALEVSGYGNTPEAIRGRKFADGLGGVANVPLMTQAYHAIMGKFFWNAIPPFPIELELIPALPGLSPVKLSSWAEIGLTPIMILIALNAPGQPSPVRLIAIEKAKAWILSRQNKDGSWYNTTLPTSLCAIALRQMGVSKDDPILKAAVRFLRSLQNSNGYIHRYTYPVWNTALACTALLDAGANPDDPRMTKAGTYLLDAQTGANGTAWPFHPLNWRYPDTDDTSFAAVILNRLGLGGNQSKAAIQWLLSMQNSDGGWAAFSKDLGPKEPGVPPGFNEDPSTADIVGHVLYALGNFGYTYADEPVARAIEWLEKDQYHASWYGRWGVCYTYGTGSALVGLKATGLSMQQPFIRDAVEWIIKHQNEDGGWGESYLAYYYPWYAGIGPSTAEQTAWSLMGLLASDFSPHTKIIKDGIKYLLANQTEDGAWASSYVDAALWVYKDDLYSTIFPLTALAMYIQSLGKE